MNRSAGAKKRHEKHWRGIDVQRKSMAELGKGGEWRCSAEKRKGEERKAKKCIGKVWKCEVKEKQRRRRAQRRTE